MNYEERVLYKYKSINDNAISSLSEKYFYFSTPEQLNDDEDSITPIKYLPDNDKQILEWIKFFKKIEGKHIDWSKYPYNTVDKIKKSILSKGFFKELIDKSFKTTASYYHVLSLSETNKSKYMWEHKDYGHDYDAICIGYRSYKLQSDFDHFYIPIQIGNSMRNEFFFKYNEIDYICTTAMKYENDRNHFYDFFNQKYSKDYSKQLRNPDTQNGLNIQYNLFNKTARWQGEHEWRSIFYDHDDLNPRVYYQNNVVESITFGHNTKIKDREKIINIIKEKYPKEKISFYLTRKENDEILIIPYEI